MMRLAVWMALQVLLRFYCFAQSVCKTTDSKVCILGAGISSVAVARALYDNGTTSFIILEASDRRITSVNFEGVNAEQTFNNILFGIDLTNSSMYHGKLNPVWTLMQLQAANFSVFYGWNKLNSTKVDIDYQATKGRYNGMLGYTAVNISTILLQLKTEGKVVDISVREEWLKIDHCFPTLVQSVEQLHDDNFYGKPARSPSAFATALGKTTSDYEDILDGSCFLTDYQLLVQYLREQSLKPNTLYHVYIENGLAGRCCDRWLQRQSGVPLSPSLPQSKLDGIGLLLYPLYMQIFILHLRGW